MSLPVIGIRNRSTVLTDDQVAAVIPALQKQVSNEFYGYWGKNCMLTMLSKDEELVLGWWEMVILDDPDLAGALGYHELNVNGGPLGKVFAGLDIRVGASWTNTFSHELLEILVDPWCNECMQGNDQKIYALEVADPVESDADGYLIEGVLVSDFITPSWYQITSADRLDFKQRLKQRFEISQGGYISIWDGHMWTERNAQTLNAPPLLRTQLPKPPMGSRRQRRNVPRDKWQRSER